MPLANGAKFAGYTIERQLGSGGMGEVYLAQHPRLPRHDAIKVLRTDISSDPDYVERFNREADLASKLWHPHIVGILDRGKYRGRLWISMDFVDGTDVSRLLQDRYPDGMPVDEALAIVKAVATALDYSHGKGLLHRDVKPANILVADVEHGERILLGDFGVARDLGDSTAAGLTATNMTVGTAAYAAPEQLMGLDLDGRADQYALAATAYHLLTGRQPFQHSNAAVVISQHLNADPPSLAASRPDLARLDSALSRAMAKVPDDRFPTCARFVEALERGPEVVAAAASLNDANTMLRTVPSAAAPPAAPPPPTVSNVPARRRRRGPWIAAAAAALLVVVALVGYFALAPASEPPEQPFNLAGSLRLTNDAIKTSGFPAGYGCAGAHEFGDVGPSAPITIADESGTLLAKGAISAGYKDGANGCVLRFRVANVPAGARFYRVHVGQHPEMSYTEAEAKAGVELLMQNNDDPASATPSSTRSSTSTRTTTAPAPPDMEQVSLARLQRIADEDRYWVTMNLADRWIPQISSKRVGIVAKGITWDNQAILDEHLRLRSIYPDVRLLWSGDWSTYDGRNFWVTVVGLHSTDPDDVLGWCVQQGFDRDNCIAKIVSTTHPIAGSTKLLP